MDDDRYSLFRYSGIHYAIECEECGMKVADLTPNHSTGELIAKLTEHDRKYHSCRY